jgi:predicted nucleotidyltransferase
MDGRAPTLVEIRDTLRPFFDRTESMVKAIVFGSYARGTQDARSDLDLLLVMETGERFLKRYDAIGGLYARIPRMEAEILIYTPEELERNAERPFLRRALSEGKVIYERGKKQV